MTTTTTKAASGLEPETARYEDLTAAETPSMIDGVVMLINRGDEDRARRIINLSLDLEHLISTLPLTPIVQTGHLVDEVREFRDQLQALIDTKIKLHILGERATDPNPDDLPDAPAKPPRNDGGAS